MAIREVAQNTTVQVSSGVGVPVAAVVANSEIPYHWYDFIWDPIWNFLPWSQIATILGIGWIAYLAYVSITDRRNSK